MLQSYGGIVVRERLSRFLVLAKAGSGSTSAVGDGSSFVGWYHCLLVLRVPRKECREISEGREELVVHVEAVQLRSQLFRVAGLGRKPQIEVSQQICGAHSMIVVVGNVGAQLRVHGSGAKEYDRICSGGVLTVPTWVSVRILGIYEKILIVAVYRQEMINGVEGVIDVEL